MLLAAAAVLVVVTVAYLARPRVGASGRVGEALVAVRSGRATAAQRRLLAREAARRGLEDVAEEMWSQADMQAALEQWEQQHRSPLPEISNQAWHRWVEANEQPAELAAQHPERTPLYGLRERELDDAGVAEPEDADDEYAALVAVTRNLQQAITTRCQGALGTEIEGQPATLSGLLAVARCAGLGGLATWVANADERKRFARTTQAYQRCNGMF